MNGRLEQTTMMRGSMHVLSNQPMEPTWCGDRVKRNGSVAIPVLLVLATQLMALQTSYRLPQRDTLKYQEFTDTRIELHPPTGAVTITTGHDATIALTTARADTVTAWYEALTLSSAGPQGEWRPSTSDVLRLPFRLVLTRAGRVTTLSTPSFPADIASHTDLTREFEDFFISLPRSELHPSVTWADTLEDSIVKSRQDNYHYRHVQGTAVFALRLGRLVTRSRRAHLVGVQTLVMKVGQLTAPIAFDYSSRLIGLR